MCNSKQAQAPFPGNPHKVARHQLVTAHNAQDTLWIGLATREDGDNQCGISPIDPPGQLRVKDLDGDLQQPSCSPAHKEWVSSRAGHLRVKDLDGDSSPPAFQHRGVVSTRASQSTTGRASIANSDTHMGATVKVGPVQSAPSPIRAAMQFTQAHLPQSSRPQTQRYGPHLQPWGACSQPATGTDVGLRLPAAGGQHSCALNAHTHTPVLTSMICPDLLRQLVGLSLIVKVDNGDLHFWSIVQWLSSPHTLAHAEQLRVAQAALRQANAHQSEAVHIAVHCGNALQHF